MSYRTGPKIVTDGLVCCLDAADRNSYSGSGGTWYDLSGNSNNGTLRNDPIFSTLNNGYFNFDGSNYIELGSSPTQNYINITISIWFYPTAESSTMPNNRNDLASKYVYPNGWLIYYRDNRFGVDGRESASLYINNQSSDTYSINNWYNVVFTKNASNWKLYVNSILQANNTWGSGSVSFSNSASFDLVRLSTATSGKGNISHIQAYDYALSDDEIKQNYEATKGRFGL